MDASDVYAYFYIQHIICICDYMINAYKYMYMFTHIVLSTSQLKMSCFCGEGKAVHDRWEAGSSDGISKRS